MTNTPIEYIRYAADQALSVPNQINLRPYTITLTTITWSGERPGLGTSTDGYTIVRNANLVNVRLRQVSKQEIVLSNGQLKDQDVVIGPIVFPYSTTVGSGGLDPAVFSSVSTSEELYINITGPNFPSGGSYFKKIYDTADRTVLYRVYLRNTAAVLPL